MGGFIGIGNQFYAILLIIFIRYLVLASAAFFVFYYVKKNAWSFKKIQVKFPAISDYQREFLFSVSTSLIFAGLGYLFFFGPVAKYTFIYKDIHAHSLWYFFFTVVLTLIIHDTYFYWTHRLMHHPRLFKYFHKVHHLSTNPSPWAAMAFHPLEAVVEFGIIAIVPFLFPIHPLALALRGMMAVWAAIIVRGGTAEMFYTGLFPIGFMWICLYFSEPRQLKSS